MSTSDLVLVLELFPDLDVFSWTRIIFLDDNVGPSPSNLPYLSSISVSSNPTSCLEYKSNLSLLLQQEVIECFNPNPNPKVEDRM